MARSEGLSEDAESSRDEELVGRTIGKYTLVRVIGKGGMGVVYEAQNTAIGKRVAIKLVGSDLARNKDAVRRFQREAQAASAVESAHIVDIFDAGTSDDGLPYIVMELLRGEDLGHRIKRFGRLELDEALHVTVQILRGLVRAHAAGIVHRDLKPDNVFLVDRDDDSAFVKILDFGISKVARRGDMPVQTLTKQGTVLGTPFYMSPEQAQGFPDTDGRADLWSVGAILYECLSGRAPHTGASYEQVIVNICTRDAADIRAHNPGVPEGVARALAKALARERDERFLSAREMLEALAAASGGTITVGPRSSDEPGASSGQEHPSHPRAARAVSSPSGDRVRFASGNGPKAVSGDGARASGGGAFEDTVEVMKGGGPSRVGWSTSGGPAARIDRKRLAIVAFGAVALGAAALIALVTREPPGPSPDVRPSAPGDVRPSGPGDETAEVTVRLRANARGARFMVDGKQIAGGLLRGRRGETRTVTVEADGFIPVEAVVSLEPGVDLPELQLSPKPPPDAVAAKGDPAPGGAPTDATPGSGLPDGAARRAKNGGTKTAASASASAKPGGSATAGAASTTSSAPATTAPATTGAPSPAGTPTLTLKRD